MLIFWLFFC